ncbi:MAG: hypothetical protein ABL879_11570 [Devosia sp.]
MNVTSIFARLKSRRARQIQALDVTQNWATRDWADLPVHHPREAR